MEHEQILQIVFTLALSGATAWGGAKYALRSHEKMITELQKDIKKMVPFDFCRNERVDCKDDRKTISLELSARFKELSAQIISSEERRHEATNQNQRLYSEILGKLTALETKLDERSRLFRKSDENCMTGG